MAALLILGDFSFQREETVYELRPGSEAKSGRDRGCGNGSRYLVQTCDAGCI
jgi:hypothetical protein